ncbi:MAG: hypothetical protein M0R00_07280 [Candidatus Omnitrophica bacterium]|jgi:hypothetical protein|nr:hypothetical protein [Candidatus Omnitrophota bacterium]
MKKNIAIMAMFLTIAGIVLAGGYDAGLITVANMDSGAAITATIIPADVSPTDITKFVGPVKLVCVIGTNTTGATGTITPVLQSVNLNSSGVATATSTVTTAMTTITNGPHTFAVKLEKGAFAYRYARMAYTVVNTDTSTWSAVAQIIGFTK